MQMDRWRDRSKAFHADADRDESDAPVPGKTTQVQRLAAMGGFLSDPAAIHAAASQGVAGAGARLPFFEQVQKSFGADHDLSAIQVHIGGAAARAAQQIGARAYAAGSSIAFAKSPDLREVAHEAAHVVQQRQGVSLNGGVGAEGDAYEQHADAVADRVVRGESAADLLGAKTGAGGGGAHAVQRLPDPPKPGDAPAPAAGGDKNASTAGAAGGVRARAMAYLAAVPPQPIASKGPDAKLYTKYTGLTQETMEENWKSGGIMTGCNGFTGRYSDSVGLGNLGTFNLASQCSGAFIRPGNGKLPKPGDVVKMKELHVTVTVSCAGEGGAWQVIEAGQGGKKLGFDLIKHDTKVFNSGDVEGWVDIELWANPAVRQQSAFAAKLAGTWQVTIDKQVWKYKFDAGGTVTAAPLVKPKQIANGTWTSTDDAVNLKWDSGVTETWPKDGVNAKSGSGTTSSSAAGSKFQKI